MPNWNWNCVACCSKDRGMWKLVYYILYSYRKTYFVNRLTFEFSYITRRWSLILCPLLIGRSIWTGIGNAWINLFLTWIIIWLHFSQLPSAVNKILTCVWFPLLVKTCTANSIKIVAEQIGKVEYKRERHAGFR